MLWYLLQISIILWLVHLYTTQLAPHQPLGDIVLFAVLITYLLTKILCCLIDWSLGLLWLIKHGLRCVRGACH